MSGLNRAIIIGNLGADPEIKYLDGGKAVCNFSLATSDTWNDKNGEKQEKTEWHRIVCWGKTAEIAAEHLSKGRQVCIEGRLQTRKWEKEGVERYTTEIVCRDLTFIGKKSDSPAASPSAPQQPTIPGISPATADVPF